MTTGSWSAGVFGNVQRYYNGNPSGVYQAGYRTTKTWSGQDNPKPPLSSMNSQRYRFFLEYDRKGRPHWKKVMLLPPLKRKRDYTVPKPYDMTLETIKAPPLTIYDRDRNCSNNAQVYQAILSNCSIPYGLPSPFIPWGDPWNANDDLNLIGRLKEAVRGSDFNMSNFLGESHQTLRMLTTAVTRLTEVVRKTRKGDVVGALKSLSVDRRGLPTKGAKNPANVHLEVQYGVLPLLGDVKAAAELLAHQTGTPYRKRVSVRRQKTQKGQRNGGGDTYRYRDVQTTTKKQLIAYLSERESLPTMLGLLDPETVIWEITPWSFIADWVIPIGDYLEARAFASHLTGTFVTTTLTETRCGDWIGLKPAACSTTYNIKECTTPIASYHKLVMKREVSTTLKVPYPAVKPLSEVASWRHAANAVALLVQVAKTKAGPIHKPVLSNLKRDELWDRAKARSVRKRRDPWVSESEKRGNL